MRRHAYAQGLAAEHTHAGQRLSLFCAGVAAMLLLQHVAAGSLLIPLALAAVSIAIWHGAFDLVLAQELLPGVSRTGWQILFVVLYIAAALGVGALWWFAPALTLILFLVYSSWHFGTESLEQLGPLRALSSFAYGALPIAAACRWHPEQVIPIFAAMLHSSSAWHTAARVSADAGSALWPLLIAFAVGFLTRPALPLFWWPALAADLLLFRFGSPLVAFAIYFCLWHTPEHLLSSSLDARGHFSVALLRAHLWRGALPWLASLAALAALCLLLHGHLLQDESALFILLSALTVPHMLLNELKRFHPVRADGLGQYGVSE